MYVRADAFVKWTASLAELAEAVGRATATSLLKDETGDFEEFPAYTGRFLDLELVVLGVPSHAEPEARNFHQVLILTSAPEEGEIEDTESVDLSENLVRSLRRGGLECSGTPPEGTTGWFCGARY